VEIAGAKRRERYHGKRRWVHFEDEDWVKEI